MRKKIFTKAVALTCAATLGLTGCGAFVSEDVTSYPMAPLLTQADVINYYAKALEYDSIVSRNLNVHETNYVTREITGERAEQLKGLVSRAEDILASTEYEVSEENVKVVTPDTYEYIKGVLDNEVISNGQLKQIRGALGYYFVDVEYDVAPSQIGAFKQTANLLGLNGVLYQDIVTGEWLIDTAYIQQIVNKMNEYYYNNLIFKEMKFDEETCVLSMETGHLPENVIMNYKKENVFSENEAGENQEVQEVTEDDDSGNGGSHEVPDGEYHQSEEGETPETTESTEEVAEGAEDTNKETTEQKPETQESESENSEESSEAVSENSTDSFDDSGMVTGGTSVTVYNTITAEDRKIQLDINRINEIVGSSIKKSSEMPPLDTVYEIPESSGSISGYGISNGGGDGLKVFDFNREGLTGKLTMRYVFKDDSSGSGEVIGRNIYIIDEDITTGISTVDNNVLIPDFLMTQFNKLIERSDRVQVDYNLPALMSGNIYEDLGVGMLRGYRDNGTNILKYMSTIRQVINRDTANNSYVVEVETTVTEGPRDVDSYGTYRDKSYVVIQQQGTEFKIIDWCRISRDVVNEAPIDPDSTTIKRLVALNLAGTIPDASKQNITKLLTNLYTAGTNRILRGPKEIEDPNGNPITIEVGLYDCFQDDTNVLSEEKYDYMNSTLQNQLVRKGADVRSRYSGVVTEWIGGYEDQAEFTTEELIVYDGTNEAYYMQVYYLVSNLNDVWVIDERTILDEYVMDDQNQIDNVKQRVGLQ